VSGIAVSNVIIIMHLNSMSARSRNARVARNCTNMEYQSRFTRHMRAMRRAYTHLSLSHSSVYARINGSAFIYIHVYIDVTGDVCACPRLRYFPRISEKNDRRPTAKPVVAATDARERPPILFVRLIGMICAASYFCFFQSFFLSAPAAPCNWQRY